MKKREFIEKYGEDAWRKKIESTKKWRDANKHHLIVYYKKYRDEHRDSRMEYNKQYKAEHRDSGMEYNKQYRAEHKEEIKVHRKDNIDKQREYNRKYFKSQIGRATRLVKNYKRNDTNAGREACTLTRGWIIEHIFNSSCVYCGDSDWTHLGADRIDNSLPHTPENCVCSCGVCNVDRQLAMMSVDEFKKYRADNPRCCDMKKVG